MGRGSKIKEVRSVCSTRIPAARQSFRELSPTPPRGIELRIRSSLSLPLPRILPSTFLEKSSSKFRGEGNFSRIFLLSTSPIIRGNRFRADPVLRAEFRFIGNRWPIADHQRRIRSAVYNHETNFDLSSPLDCPRTLHPLSSPKSHRRNGGRGKNRLLGVFRDPEGLIAFLDTRQRYSFRPRNPNRATLSPLRTKGIRRYLNFLSLQDNLPFFSLKKREVAILIPLFPLELSLWNIGRVSTLFRRTGTVVAGRKRGGGS